MINLFSFDLRSIFHEKLKKIAIKKKIDLMRLYLMDIPFRFIQDPYLIHKKLSVTQKQYKNNFLSSDYELSVYEHKVENCFVHLTHYCFTVN
jgi:hypothetical protein